MNLYSSQKKINHSNITLDQSASPKQVTPHPNFKINSAKSSIQNVISLIQGKKASSINAIKQIWDCNQALLDQLNSEHTMTYVEKLEAENLKLKKLLNLEIKKNNSLLRKIDKLESEQTHDCDLIQIQNKGLKQRVLHQDQQYNRLYMQLELLKKNGDNLRKQTINLLESGYSKH